jgi:hypothetical protein|tara:strand:- start:360 stop:1295 length:936 start_codon:yes stop_codon:yes gene_type:complete
MKWVLSALLIVVLAGCETFGDRITEEQLAAIDKVAVVSLIDDQIAYSYVGVTIFNNENNLYPFPGLGIDNYITTTMTEALSRVNPRVKVLPVDADFATYRAAYKNEELIASLDNKKFISLFASQASQMGLRYVVVASRDSIQFDQTPVNVNGFGLRKHVASDDVGAFVLIKFELIDLVTQKVLAKARVFERDYASEFAWLEPFANNDEAFKTSMRDYIYQAIDGWTKSVSSTLLMSQKDQQVCAKQVYARGFEIDGVNYTTQEAVLQQRYEYIRNKIMNEEAKGDDALPPYEERFKATEDKVIDCLSQLNR